MRRPVIALLARDLPADISLIIGNSHIFAYVYLNYTHRHETCQASIAVSIRMVKRGRCKMIVLQRSRFQPNSARKAGSVWKTFHDTPGFFV